MSNAITIAPKQLPAELASAFGGDRTADLISSSGGFPVISIRGSKFRVKVAGEEKPLINAQTGDPMPSLQPRDMGGHLFPHLRGKGLPVDDLRNHA